MIVLQMKQQQGIRKLLAISFMELRLAVWLIAGS